MGRCKRITYPGLTYHVINRGNNRQAIFLEEDDYKKYLAIVYRFKRKYGFKLFAYCFMTNHVHLLIQVGEKGTISRIMQSITVAHTRHYHYKYRTSGHVWQGRFNSPVVSDDEYMLEVMRYIEQNPVRAKMVREIEDYTWSSYRLNIRAEESKLIDRRENKAYQTLGETDDDRRRQYVFMLREEVKDKALEEIRESSQKGIYASEKFKSQIDKMIVKKVIRRNTC
ncbi:MAG: transposase [Candidatus Omnitrophica bacterium]|nr:transposase [Candidatus Omnitrophota bacterium]